MRFCSSVASMDTVIVVCRMRLRESDVDVREGVMDEGWRMKGRKKYNVCEHRQGHFVVVCFRCGLWSRRKEVDDVLLTLFDTFLSASQVLFFFLPSSAVPWTQ